MSEAVGLEDRCGTFFSCSLSVFLLQCGIDCQLFSNGLTLKMSLEF